jgi:twinkle protein
VVSVPNGARGFTWYQHCSEWLGKFAEIIVFGDNEHGEITLVNELQARVDQKLKVVRAVDYLGEKDANDILRKYGKDAIIKAVENAEVPKLKNVKKLSEVKSVNLMDMPKIRTGLHELDKVVGGLYLGQVSLWSGKRGEGKSTLASQVIAEAVEQNWTTFVYSGELPDFHFKRWLDMQLAGPDHLVKKEDVFGEEYYTIPDDVQKKINDWYQDKIYIYDNAYIPETASETETLLTTIEKVIKQYDTKLICLDNLMTAMDQVDGKDNLYTAQSNFVWSLKNLAMKYNVHIMLVAHPRKTQLGEMSNDDISGSGDITNKVDTVIFYGRQSSEEDGKGHITVTKNRLTGKLAVGKNIIQTQYSKSSKRIATGSFDAERFYGWEQMKKSECDDGFYVIPGDAECPF